MLKVLIFDFDGTLADTFDAVHEAVCLALDALGQPRISRARLMDFFSGSAAEYAREMLPEDRRADAALVARANEMITKTYGETYLHTEQPYAGIPAALAALRGRFRLGMLSNKPQVFLEGLDRKLFPAGTFSVVHGVRVGVPAKPDPTAALSIAAMFGATSAECAIIGDSEVDLKTAANAGMHAIGACWGYRGEAFLRACGATHLAHSPADLVRLLGEEDF